MGRARAFAPASFEPEEDLAHGPDAGGIVNWFFTLNEEAFRADRYADMIKVAVHTALKKTSLVPHMLYDGGETPLTGWLRARGVRIIPGRSFVYEPLVALARERRDPNILAIGAGAFLRVDLPTVAREHGIRDAFVLYTDVDVMFTRDVTASLDALRLATSPPRPTSTGPISAA